MRTIKGLGLCLFSGLIAALPAVAETPNAPAATPVAAVSSAPASAPADGTREEAVKAEQPSAFMELPPALVTLGGRAWEEGSGEEFGDLLLPVYSARSGLLFLNPRSSFSGEESEMNLGGGYRQLIGDHRMIAGVNAYYDRRETEGNNTFHEAGFGLEFLSDWVDARANLYLPEDDIKTVTETVSDESYEYDARTYDWNRPQGSGHAAVQSGTRIDSRILAQPYTQYTYQEQAMEGFDCEVGVRLPIPLVQDWTDIKVFAGYYAFDNDISDSIEGWKGRLEVRALPAVVLDAEVYEDDDLNDSSYYVGARFQAPFDIGAMAAGRNPFAGTLAGFKPARRNAAQPFDARLTEMVIRDMRVQIQQSDVPEIVPFVQETVLKQTTKRIKDVLADDLIYVDRDNTSGVEDGTYEHPYSTISEGLAAAGGDMKTVFVFDSATAYNEQTVITEDGIALIGSGTGLQANGGRIFGTGVYPVLEGRPLSVKTPANPFGTVTIWADDVTISGFEFRGQLTEELLGRLPRLTSAGGTKIDYEDIALEAIRYTGILAFESSNLLIENNRFSGHAAGVLVINGNDLPIGLLTGAKRDPVDPHAVHSVILSENRFERNLIGALVVGFDGGFKDSEPDPVPSEVILFKNDFQDNLLGAGVLQVGGGLTVAMVANSFNNGLMPAGIGSVIVNVEGDMAAVLADNTLSGNHTIGFGLIQEYGSLDAMVIDNTIRDCQFSSLVVEANAFETILDEADELFKYKPGDVSLTLSGNTISDNGRSIDLTDWIQPVGAVKEIDPIIEMPDAPAVIFALRGGNVAVTLAENTYDNNRGGALGGMMEAYDVLAVSATGERGTGNGGICQGNPIEIEWDDEFPNERTFEDYSYLLLGKTEGSVDAVPLDVSLTDSRLVAMDLLKISGP